MEPKWIELLKPVDDHKAGEFLEVTEEIARAYIAAGLARDGGKGPDTILLERSLATFRTELRGVVADVSRTIGEATTALAKRPNIQGLEGRIDALDQQADKSKGVGDFVRNVVRACDPRDLEGMQTAQERLTKEYGVKRGMTEGTGTAGGFTTPVLYETQILAEAAEDAVYISDAREVPLGARQVEWPALNQFAAPAAGQSAMFGGVTVSRKGENTQRSSVTPTLKKVVLDSQDLTFYFEIGRDLIADSTGTLDSMLPMLGGNALGWRIDWECLNGNGIGQFLGILNAPATLLVSRNTSGHIKYQDVFTMYTKLLPSSKKRAKWVVHPYAMSDILQLQDPGGRFIYIPNWPASQEGPIGQSPSGRLLGLPLVESEKAPAPGSTGDLVLFDGSKYLHGKRSGLEIGLSEHFKFDTDQIAIRGKVRNDGQPWLKAPIYLADGSQSNQVSAFVALQ